MPENEPPQSSVVLYQTEDGRTRIQCRFENETIWLTQALIAELFQTSIPNINLHLKAIYATDDPAWLWNGQAGRAEFRAGMKHVSLAISIMASIAASKRAIAT